MPFYHTANTPCTFADGKKSKIVLLLKNKSKRYLKENVYGMRFNDIVNCVVRTMLACNILGLVTMKFFAMNIL